MNNPEDVKMPAGQFAGWRIGDVPLHRLVWWVTQDGLRRKEPILCLAILELLGKRIADGSAVRELLGEAYDLI
jgi:hypothetical protein